MPAEAKQAILDRGNEPEEYWVAKNESESKKVTMVTELARVGPEAQPERWATFEGWSHRKQDFPDWSAIAELLKMADLQQVESENLTRSKQVRIFGVPLFSKECPE